MKMTATFILRGGKLRGGHYRVTRTREISPRCTTQQQRNEVLSHMHKALVQDVKKQRDTRGIMVYFESVGIS